MSIEEYSDLKLYHVQNEGVWGIYIEGFETKLRADEFIESMDALFITSKNPTP